MDTNVIKKIFFSSLKLKKNTIITKLNYGDQKWDSVAHMYLVAQLEKKLKIAIDIEDVIDMSSFNKTLDILKKYTK